MKQRMEIYTDPVIFVKSKGTFAREMLVKRPYSSGAV